MHIINLTAALAMCELVFNRLYRGQENDSCSVGEVE